jgi:VanZ family protein
MTLNTRSSRRWLAVIVMMLVTFVFGTDLFSAENTRPIVRWIMRLFFGEETADQKVASGGEGLMRKSAHFLEYGLLAFLWLRALRGDETQNWRWHWFLIALLATVLWATVDELQQGFISQHRTGSPWDVLLDSCGGLTALLLAHIIHMVGKLRQQRI